MCVGRGGGVFLVATILGEGGYGRSMQEPVMLNVLSVRSPAD
jgi:hypothetical protein